jgi:hypothetical protein
LGSDGFWKEIDEHKLPDIIKNYGTTKGLSQYLVDLATQGKEISVDNITLICIDLGALIDYKLHAEDSSGIDIEMIDKSSASSSNKDNGENQAGCEVANTLNGNENGNDRIENELDDDDDDDF